MPRSLLLICHSYPPVIGGSEIEAQRVCAALRARGWSITVVCAGGDPMPPLASWQDPFGTPVECCGSSTRLGVYFYTLGVLWRLWRKRGDYSAVYFLMPGLQVALGVPFAAALGKKIYMKFSGSNEIRKLLASSTGRSELNSLARHASRILLLNDGMYAEAQEARLPVEKLLWMPNPVDVNVFAPLPNAERQALRRELEINEKDFAIVFVGRMAPEKQLPILIEAFAQAVNRHSNALLILVGEGPERSALERASLLTGCGSRIRFVGRAEPNSVHRWLQAGDAFALLSSLEGFPVALLEAMSTALPAVASDIPANRQLLRHNEHGFLVPPGDASAAAIALTSLIADRARSAAWGLSARSHVECRYSLEAVASRYEELFLQS